MARRRCGPPPHPPPPPSPPSYLPILPPHLSNYLNSVCLSALPRGKAFHEGWRERQTENTETFLYYVRLSRAWCSQSRTQTHQMQLILTHLGVPPSEYKVRRREGRRERETATGKRERQRQRQRRRQKRRRRRRRIRGTGTKEDRREKGGGGG